MKKKLGVMALAVGLLAAGGVAQAGATYEGYDLIVPGYNQSAYTTSQTKSTSNAAANLKVTTLGKAMDARVSAASGTGAWVRLSTTGTYDLPNSISAGKDARVHFSADLNQLVNAAVKGSWKSN